MDHKCYDGNSFNNGEIASLNCTFLCGFRNSINLFDNQLVYCFEVYTNEQSIEQSFESLYK